MKKITFFVFAFLSLSFSAFAQYSFPTIAGPTNVAAGTPVTLNINDSGNTVSVPAASTGSYGSFSISADWVAGAGNPWSVEGDVTVNTTGSSVQIDPPTAGGGNSGAATTLTFDGDFTTPYVPSTDGLLDIILNQSYGGSDADWSNIVVTIFESPSCIAPSGMVSANTTTTGTDLSWTAGDTETAWNLEWKAGADFVPGNSEEDGTASATPTPDYSPTGLTPDTTYYVYYQANCGGGDTSEWVGPFTFITGYCDSVPTSNDGDGITNIILGSTSFPSGGDLTYENFTATTVDLSQSVTANLQISFATGFTYDTNVWIDFNNDLVFDSTTELVYQGTSLATNPTTLDASFLMPTVPLGVYRMRIGTADTGQATPNPCYSGTWGVTVDMSINVTVPPACIPPSGLMAQTITDSSADISWTANNGEAGWEIVVQPAGTGAPTGSGTAITVNPYSATALNSSTAYEVYVRADCMGNGLSTWSGPLTFTTLNTPPPPPNGVTCNSGTSSFVFSEDFEIDPAAGWTGTTFSGGNGDWDITAGNANSTGTGPFASFSGGMHLEYEASGNSTTIASAISPAIDLSSAVDGAELSFYMHAYGADMGTLNVGVGTSATGPFTSVYTWIGDYQASDTEAWVPIGVNLDAYLGQIIYVEFSYGGAGTGWEGDMSIDLFRVESCGSFCIAPNPLTVANVTGTTADFNWTANNGETEWEYVVQPAGTGEPTSGTLVSTSTINETGLTPETDYEVYVRANCGANGYSEWISVTFTTPPGNDACVDAITVSCGDSITGDTTNATENDELTDFCGTGQGAPGLWYTYTGTGDLVTMSLCGSSYDTKIQVYEGACGALTCVTGNDDSCGLQSEVQFLSTVGTTYYIYVFGFGTSTGAFNLDITCIPPPPPPVNDECDSAIVLTANPDANCTSTETGTIFGATASPEANGCFGTADDDVWYQFTAVATDHAIDLSNIVGDTQDLYHVLYEGSDCNNLTEIYCSDANQSVANGLTVGNTYYIRVYSWTGNPLQDVTFDICVFTIPPPIYTSETDYTVDQIIKDVLANENPDCPQIYNITYSTGTNFGTTNGIGYFEANGSSWPFGAGLIMTTGDINNAPGPEDEVLSDGGNAWPGDADLENAVPTLLPGESNNASIIEFDFVPIIQSMSFDFIFAAEEYGTFQCGFTDAFAFLLTDSNGVTTNLAIVPGTVDPISVFTVRDDTYNNACPSVNPEYFDKFYGNAGENPLTAPIDFRGHTVVMTAEADVIPGEQYHIKLVVADDGDTLYDSSVFIGAGTFDIGYPDLGEDILLGSGQETCEGNPLTLDCGEIPQGAMVEWFMDGELIEGENSQTIQVTETAFYGAEFSYPNGECALYDEVLVEFFENPQPVPVQETVIRCVGLEVTLEVTVSNSDVPDTLTYYWTYNGVDIQTGLGPENTSYTIAAESDELGEYIVTVIDERGCYGDTIINVVEGVYPVVEAVEPLVNKCINEDVTLEAIVTNADALSSTLTYTWYVDGIQTQSSSDNTYVHASGESEAIVTVMVTDEASQCTNETDIAVVYYENSNCVDLPQGLSPNGDGFNDCLILDHLEDKENITYVEVFNRYGSKIYELNEYIDEWCGTDQDGNKMPVGTYFYIVHTKVKEPRTSWIYLNY